MPQRSESRRGSVRRFHKVRVPDIDRDRSQQKELLKVHPPRFLQVLRLSRLAMVFSPRLTDLHVRYVALSRLERR